MSLTSSLASGGAGPTASGETMQAVQITRYGGVEGLELREAPRPSVGPGQVLVRIRAAGVNPFDSKIRAGYLAPYYPLDLPATAGGDFAGEVAAVGDGVTHLAPGDRVYGLVSPMNGGAYAQYLAIDARLVRPMPKTLSFVEAAALPMAGQTALYALTRLAAIAPGDRVLVHAGAGGVGAIAIQIAKSLGAYVYATCSTRNLEMLKRLGADVAIDYTTTDFRQVAKDVKVAVDPLGGDVNLKTYETMAPGGVILVVLRNDAVEAENRSAYCERYGVQSREVAFENEPDLLDELRALVEAGAVDPNVTTVLPLAQAAEGQTLSASGHAAGKIVLEIP